MPFEPHPTDPNSVIYKMNEHWLPKPWVGLTNEEVQEIAKQLVDDAAYCSTHFAIAIESRLKEKNGG